MVFPIIPIVISAACILGLVIILFYSYRELRKLKIQIALSQVQLLKEINLQQELAKELTQLKEKFAHDVLYDSLTGLAGRQVFEDRLVQTLNQSKRYQLIFGVLFLDLDGFKVINEALGHDVGDELLKEVAERLKNTIRQVDSLCRFGGDQFVLILSQLSKPESAAYVAQRILDAITQPFKVRNHELFITASIGIATYPTDGDEAKILLKNADNALHQAKSRGRNTYQFYREEMHILSQRELTLSSSLQHAEVYREFSIFYQPQINLENKKIASMQALLHWEHPDFGLIALPEFLRLAENNGKIIAIGEWLLRNAFQQFQQWKKLEFCPNSIAINVSLRQVENPHFTYKLSQILQEMNIDPACLVVEVSETLLAGNVELLEKSFHMLKHLGVQTAIKDFGAGHLSLQFLKRFPIDYLKIADTLIQDISVNKESESIVKMIIALAKSLQINVIAEGVESRKQKQVLVELGCNNMQGHLFSAPFRAEEFTQDKVASCMHE
ncbi:MAG: putative bifunctional diguanylate cyclase/phosphodiesterase [Gammaproteobacteria bacterium]